MLSSGDLDFLPRFCKIWEYSSFCHVNFVISCFSLDFVITSIFSYQYVLVVSQICIDDSRSLMGSVENISISDRTDAEIQTGLGIEL